MSEEEKSPPKTPSPPRTPAEAPSPGRVTPTLTDVVKQLTVRALKEYADLDTGVVDEKDTTSVKVKKRHTALGEKKTFLEGARVHRERIKKEGEEKEEGEEELESTDFDSHGEEDLHASIQSSGSSTGSRPGSSAERRAAHRAQRSAGSRAGELEEGRTGELEEDRTEDEGTEGRRKGQPSSGRRTSKQKRRKSHDRRASKQVERSKSAMEDADRDSTSVEMESEGREQAGVADEEAGVVGSPTGGATEDGVASSFEELDTITTPRAVRRRRLKKPPKKKVRAIPDAIAMEAVGMVERDVTPPPAQPAGGKKKTRIDDESSCSESEESSADSSGTSSDGGDEMVVLDPDHPLMNRFQNALYRHLSKQINKINLEVNELDFLLKAKQRDREDIGVDLYSVQQELARNQMSVEQLHDEYAKHQKQRVQAEQELKDIRETYTEKQKLIKMERKKAADLLAEVENLALRLYYMESAKNDVRSDIAVMKRAAEKAEMEVAKSEMEKQKQDVYVNRLVERVDKLQETIAMYDAQITAQREETKAAEDALSEARMEIEAITLEKKQLFHQWNCSLIGMRRRDEARAAMQDALDQEHQRIISLETEIEGYKRSTQKEQEHNEKLTMILNKAENDIATTRKQMMLCQTKLDALKNEYATYTRMMHETEHSLNRANADKAMWVQEQNAVRKQVEQQYAEKVRLEDGILQKMHDQLTIDKAAKYTFKLIKQLRQKTKATATNIARIENDISNDTLEGSNLRACIERLTETTTEFEEEIRMKNEIVSRCLTETIKRNATIERKQGVIDQLNKKIDQLLTQSGGVELGPLEVTINSLQKSILAEHEETTELQNMWLRNQHELVQLTKERDSQQCDINNIKKQLTILQQRKLRTEGEIEMEKAEALEQERDILTIENDMMKLNVLLYKKRGLHHELEQSNSLMESDFIGSLKEAERESIELQESLNGLQEEKERLLNSLVEAERQIMLWEKKTQLARETRSAVDSDIGEGEIKAMKAEIHRMQVRHGQLIKTQERMIQDMEKAVSRRDTIVTRGEARAKLNKKVVTKGKFQRQLAELRKKIKSAIAEANSCDDEIENLRSDQVDLSRHLEEKQLDVQQQQASADILDGDIERHMEEKQKNLLNLVLRQQKAKFYQQMKDGKYVRVCRTDSARQTERARQEERMQSILAIVDRLTTDLPNLQPSLQRVSNVYGTTGCQDSLTSPTTSH